jgi:oxygen-independent coproporphyrinogen-3 oxidase
MTGNAPLSLYLHVPFCALKCRYCDFNSYAGLERLVPRFAGALADEARLWGRVAPGTSAGAGTVYFGGGTPSLLPLEHVERIMTAVRESFGAAPEAEVSLEANPGTVDARYLRGLLAAGVNRLSLGVQSFHDDELAALGRVHTADQAREACRLAREAGFQRVSLDLIYGLPEQPVERWQATLEEAIALAPEHLSLYALTVEEGTGLAHDVAQGRTPEPDPDAQAAMYEWSMDRLARAGYRQYEISNWALPGGECRHNLVYWRNGEWLGLGPGAHSHLGGYRFANVYSPRQYVRRVRETVERGVDASADPGALLRSMRQVAWTEAQAPDVAMADTAILALRLNEGLDPAEFARRFRRPPEAVFGSALAEMAEAGLIERAGGRVRLTPRGRLLANEAFVRLLPG